VWHRLRVLTLGFAGFAVLALLQTAGCSGVRLDLGADQVLDIWMTILAGWFTPLALDPEHWHMGISGWLMFIGNLALLLAHPLRPGRVTGALTLLGVVGWLFWGYAVAYVSV
jgi:hypothetical protein